MSNKTAFTIFVGTDIWGTAPAIGSAPVIALAQAIERSTRGDPNRGVIEVHADWLDIPFARIENGGAVTHRVDVPGAKLYNMDGYWPGNNDCYDCGRVVTDKEAADCGGDSRLYCEHCRAKNGDE